MAIMGLVWVWEYDGEGWGRSPIKTSIMVSVSLECLCVNFFFGGVGGLWWGNGRTGPPCKTSIMVIVVWCGCETCVMISGGYAGVDDLEGGAMASVCSSGE